MSIQYARITLRIPQGLSAPTSHGGTLFTTTDFAGAAERWPDGIPNDTLLLIEKELTLIRSNCERYLTVQDIVQFARSQNILCQGRGSAANSAVCYCLFITEVDPAQCAYCLNVSSMERNEPPAIDVDFEHERREKVIQYIYTRWRPLGTCRHFGDIPTAAPLKTLESPRLRSRRS